MRLIRDLYCYCIGVISLNILINKLKLYKTVDLLQICNDNVTFHISYNEICLTLHLNFIYMKSNTSRCVCVSVSFITLQTYLRL